MHLRAHPIARGLASIGVLASVVGTRSLDILVALNILFIVLGALAGTLRSQLVLWRNAIIPLLLVYSLVWGAFLQTAPGGQIGADPWGGLQHSIILCLRIGLAGSAFQAIWLSIAAEDVPSFLRSSGLRGEPLVLALAFLGGFDAIRQTVYQVVTALLIRGKIKPNSWFSRLGAVPEVLLNIWAPALSLAFARVEHKWGPLAFLEIADVSGPRYPHLWLHDALAIGLLGIMAALLSGLVGLPS